MKTKKQFLWMLFAILVCGFTAVTMASCGGSDDDDDITGGGSGGNGGSSGSSYAEMLKTPLTLEAIEAGTITLNNDAVGPITYRVNDGAEQTIKRKTKGEITVEAGDKVTFYGDNATYVTSNLGPSPLFSNSADFYIYGNIMSLVSSSNFATAEKLEGDYTFQFLFYGNTHLKNHPSKQLILPAKTLTMYCYSNMFMDCKGLSRAPELPATTLAEGCYSTMFYGCTGLTEAPELPAKKLAKACYRYMFSGCTGLTEAPKLPATTLAENCYSIMFSSCTGLAEAPKLPATTLARGCYENMFYGCTGLTETPELPATTMAEYCYKYMFGGCKNLSSVTCLATDISASNAIENWLKGVSSTGSFTKAKGVKWPTGNSGIPEGWTVEEQ